MPVTTTCASGFDAVAFRIESVFTTSLWATASSWPISLAAARWTAVAVRLNVVTCARAKKFLWSTSYHATEACRIVVRSETKAAEAAAARASREWVVELVTEEPTKTARLSR